MISPIKILHNLNKELGVQIYVKRDDLLPMTGGGNKARKIIGFLEEAELNRANALITTGGLQSNHARVTALAAAERGWKCKLILHGNPERSIGGNLLLMKLAGAEISVVEPSGIGLAMAEAERDYLKQGLTPYTIPGGGHAVRGALAYYEAAQEIVAQFGELDIEEPDFVVVPSGTGTTQAGLIVGFERLQWSTQVVGTSVARRNPRGKRCVVDAVQQLRSYLDMPNRATAVDFRDDWVGGGYEQASQNIYNTIEMVSATEGLILDPTYTGKAFTALLDLVREGVIAYDKKVLFWHTGGLLNLLASPYYTSARK